MLEISTDGVIGDGGFISERGAIPARPPVREKTLADFILQKTFTFTAANVGTNMYYFHFNPDGTKIWTYSYKGKYLRSWALSVPWDVSTIAATYSETYTSPYNNAYGMTISSDGRWVLLGHANQFLLAALYLSTAWDVSTAAVYYTKGNSSSYTIYRGYWMVPGNMSIVCQIGYSSYNLYQATMTAAGNVSTIGSTTKMPKAPSPFLDTVAIPFCFSVDGLRMYAVFSNIVRRYDLTAAWDVSTAVDSGLSLTMPVTPYAAASSIRVSSDETRLYVNASYYTMYQFGL